MSTAETTLPPLTGAHTLHLGGLTIRSQRDGDAHVLVLAGELDMDTARELEAELKRIEGTTATLRSIVIDLRGLTFIDSTGLRLLVEASHRAETAGHTLRLLQPTHTVFRVCVIAGIHTLLPFERVPLDADA